MKRAIVFVAACAMFAGASAQVYVKPHIQKDGTFVGGHFRSAPNSTDLDNYSTRGNINPYTGMSGTKAPSFDVPAYKAPSFSPQCGYTSTGRYVCR